MAGRLQHLGEAAILALLDGGESGDSDSDMVSIMSKYQKPDIKQMFLVLQVDFFCLNIAIPQLLTKSPLPLGNNNYNPIMSTYLGPRMKLICFYLRLVRGGGPPHPPKTQL